jgi:hypothetical protein
VKRIVVTAALIVACAQSHGATTITMIDLPIPGSPRILDVRPDNAIATLITIPGGAGVYDIVGNALPASVGGMCNPVARNALAFAANGIAVVLVDRLNYAHPPIVEWLWNRDRLPVWVNGTSASTSSAVDTVAAVQATVPSGLFVASAVGASGHSHEIVRPALLIYHSNDSPSNSHAPQLYEALANATPRKLVAFSGGGEGFCGVHLLQGLDPEFVAEVTAFITANNPPVPSAGPLAIEYFNAGFGHYFMTADPDESAGLDAGAYGGAFVRTNRSFKVHDVPAAATVPVCRFFTTPGTFGFKSSHFYTADADECEGLKLNPNWIYEKIAFHVAVPTAGVCPAGTVPVYRMYNHGQTGAPNHRFTTDLALYQQFTTTQGWDAEGIAFCAPA